MYPAPDARVRTPDDRLVIGRHPYFKFGDELKFRGILKAGSNRVAARKLLYQTLVKPHTLVRLYGGNKTGTFQTCNVGTRPARAFGRDHYSFGLGVGGVVPQHSADGIQKGGLAVPSRAV